MGMEGRGPLGHGTLQRSPVRVPGSAFGRVSSMTDAEGSVLGALITRVEAVPCPDPWDSGTGVESRHGRPGATSLPTSLGPPDRGWCTHGVRVCLSGPKEPLTGLQVGSTPRTPGIGSQDTPPQSR